MEWGSDELGHRSAERSGWAAELRSADPEEVDDTVAGAVEFAAATVDDADAGEAIETGAVADEADAGSAVVADASGVAGAAAAAEAAASEATTAEDAAAETAADAATDAADGLDDAPDDADAEIAPTFTCSFCRREVPEAEALDADGLPIGEFEWVADPDVGEREAYHRECVDAGEGRFLPWGAGGALGDE